MTVELTPAVSRFITLKGNRYLYQQYAPCKEICCDEVQSKLFKYNRETCVYEPVSEKLIRYFDFGSKEIIHDYPRRSFNSMYNTVHLTSTGKYSWIEIHEPGAKLNLWVDNSYKPKLGVFNIKENLSELSPFARKHISKVLKGLIDGTVVANVNWRKLLSSVKGWA